MKNERFKLAGCSHYEDNIMSLATPNPDYDLSSREIKESYNERDKIPEYQFFHAKCELIPEPTNKYDPNAIKVLIDNILVGYIKAGSCSHVKKIMADSTARFYVDEMGLGDYKTIIDNSVIKDSFSRPFVTIAVQYGEKDAPQAPQLQPEAEPPKAKTGKTTVITWRIVCMLWLLVGLMMLLINPVMGLGIIAIVIIIILIMGKRGK